MAASKRLSVFLLGCTSVAAMASVAFAQGAADETVEVSASRITIQGYTAPTPVTVVGLQQLQSDAKVSIGDTIRELPSVGRSDSPNNGSHSNNAGQGDAGIDTINLRDLGVKRTLTLFNHQRVVTSNPDSAGGGVDLSTIPSGLIQRIDVVTGGASAAWGSDAVSGVVNLVLNTTFEGVKGNMSFGDSAQRDHQTYKAELTVGTAFDGDRGHVILSGTYSMSPDPVFYYQRSWWQPQTLFSRASLGLTTGPNLVHTFIKGSISNTQGGLVTASTAGTAPVQTANGGTGALAGSNALRGIQFGVGGTQASYNFGQVFGTNCAGNCSANLYSGQPPFISVPYHNGTFFGYASYMLTDTIKASVQLNYGQNYEMNTSANRNSTVTVKIDNPFLDPGLAQRMRDGGIASFSLTTNNFNNLPDPKNPTMRQLLDVVGQNVNINTRQLARGVFTLEGSLGSDWSWEAYALHGQVRVRQHEPSNSLTAHYNNAVDAVRVTATGANSLGGGNTTLAGQVTAALTAAGATVPQIGQIVCRSALTATSWGITPGANGAAPTIAAGGLFAGCQPLNVMGTGVATQAAIDYIQPGKTNLGIEDQATYLMNQDVFSGSVQGVLPWELPAGKVALATGFEYRHEQQTNIRDPLQIGLIPGWGSGNFNQFKGQYTVQEGFLEINAPILKDTIVQTLDFNVAGRITSYSTSGMVETWKLGLTSQINDDFKVRVTWSEDIRAPVVSELFAPAQFNRGNNTPDIHNANAPVSIFYTAQGNPLLKPEAANTITGGVVYTPSWLDNFSMSLDWYSIVIKGAIFTAGNNAILQQCQGGATLYCSQLFFGSGVSSPGAVATTETDGNGLVNNSFGLFPADYNNALNFILNVPLNAASETTSGLDFEADYRMELFDGILNWNLRGNYNDQRTRTALGQTFDAAGALGGDAPVAGAPKFHANLRASYAEDNWDFTAQGRFIGTAQLITYLRDSANNKVYWKEGVDIDSNSVPAVVYLDLRGSYKISDKVTLYGAIDNVFNAPPPNIASSAGGSTSNLTIYDGLGRAYRIGVRFLD